MIGILVMPIPLTQLTVRVDRDQFTVETRDVSESRIDAVVGGIRPELELIAELNRIRG